MLLPRDSPGLAHIARRIYALTLLAFPVVVGIPVGKALGRKTQAVNAVHVDYRIKPNRSTTYDPATRGGDAPDGRKVKSTLHWVSAAHALPAEVRLYGHLMKSDEVSEEKSEGGGGGGGGGRPSG